MKSQTPFSRKWLRETFLSTLWRENPVLIQAMGLCPVIGAATTLKNSVTLALCTLVTLLLTDIFMSLLGKRLPVVFRAPVCTVFAVAVLTAEALFVRELVSTELYASLYLFLPLMATTMLFNVHGNAHMGVFLPMAAVIEAVSSACGFGLILCLVGGARELLTKQTIWDISVDIPLSLSQAALPFAAFLALGLLAAVLQASRAHAARKTAHKHTTEGGNGHD